MKRYTEAAYADALRRILKRKPDRKPDTLLTLLSPTEVLEKCSADRERLWNARTFLDALTVVNDIAPFWVEYEEDHPRLADLVLRTARRLIANYRRRSNYPELSRTPTDWIGLLDWTPDALNIVRRCSAGKETASQPHPTANASKPQAEGKRKEWKPPKSYTGAKSTDIPRSTLEGWEKQDDAPGRPLRGKVKQDPTTREKYYPNTWLNNRKAYYRPRKKSS